MNQNPFQLGCGNTDADNLVDKLIGNAYQVVKYVALNVPKLTLISDNMAKLTPLGDNIAALLELDDSLPALLVLHTNLAAFTAVTAELPAIVAVYNNLPAVVNASDNMAAIVAAPDMAFLAQEWATKPTGEVVVGLGFSAYYWAQQAATNLASKANTADLLSSTDLAKGAGMVGFAPGLVYGANTIGAYAKTLTVKTDLADTVDAAKGAALVGYADALAYAAGSVGAYLKTRAPKPVENAGAPAAGTAVVGARSVNTAPTIAAPVVEWVCTVAGTPGTWRALSWLVFSGITADRPVLPANASGVVYLDTTLAADGKPITWNGAAWVDATGVIV